jgi:hypothetical protein
VTWGPRATEGWRGQLGGAAAPGPAFSELGAALDDWRRSGLDGVLRIVDNGAYRWGKADLTALHMGGAQLRIEAASGFAPSIGGDLALRADGARSTLTLDGLWCGGRLSVNGAVTLALRHCTLLPGRGPSLSGPDTANDLHITLVACISGALRFMGKHVRLDISDSIVDAGAGRDAEAVDSGEVMAIDGTAGVTLGLRRCTVLGSIAVDVDLVADSLVSGAVHARQQEGRGQMRFSYGQAATPAPHRYRCHPDPGAAVEAAVRPAFTSRRYGSAGYCQLSARCSAAISAGAENGSEMGAFHQLSQHLRHEYLQRVIAEYLPHTMHAGVYFLT